MKDVKKPTKRLRELLAEDKFYIAPGAYNALTARMIERAGFEIVGTTGYGIAADILGTPDLGLVSRDLMVQLCSYMADSVSIPVLADSESGFGDALGVWFTIRAMEKAGIAGLFIEDQTNPPACPFIQKPTLVSCEEMVGKIKAAIDARTDPDFVIMARTDAHGEEGLRRAKEYIKAGADMIKPVPKDLQEAKDFAKVVDVPMHLGYIPGQVSMKGATFEELGKMGYKIISFPISLLFYSTKQTLNLLKEIHDTKSDTRFLEGMTTMAEFIDLVGGNHFRELATKYLPTPPSKSQL
jgi:2,3-dimethylmalate lyase